MNQTHDHTKYTGGHHFLGAGHEKAEQRAKLVTVVTAVFMVVEITVGVWSGSMALLADGVHMLTHVGALGLAALTYALARRHDGGDARFSFGSGKFGDLSAFASAVFMAVLAVAVAVESIGRLISPEHVAFGEAFFVAVIGLVVNLICAALLGGHHHHHHDHAHPHEHEHEHHDHDHDHGHEHEGTDNNLRAAYVHVLADALTSVLAIAALACGYYFGILWFDAIAGLVGAVMIGLWAWGLMRDSGAILLDVTDDLALARDIQNWICESYAVSICDFHLWQLGPGHKGLIVSLVCRTPLDADTIKHELAEHFPGLSHITVETEICSCGPAAAEHAD